MPKAKITSEVYDNLGGINSKISIYASNGLLEFLDLKNLDFQTPGALTKSPGSSYFIGQTFPGKIQSLYEFEKLDGSSYLVTSHSGAIWFGVTTGQLEGMSFTYRGATIVVSGKVDAWDWSTFAGALVSTPDGELPYNGVTIGGYRGTGATHIFHPVVQGKNRLDFETLQNYLYAGSDKGIFKFSGTTTSSVGVPFPILLGSSVFGTTGLANRYFVGEEYVSFFWGAFVNDRGFVGPVMPLVSFYRRGPGGTGIDGSSLFSRYGSSLVVLRADIYTPLGYGISAIRLYSYTSQATGNSSLFAYYLANNTALHDFSDYAVSGSTITNISIGYTSTSQDIVNGNKNPISKYSVDDSTFETCLGMTFSNIAYNGGTRSFFLYQQLGYQFAEIHANRVFLSGLTGAPSDVIFSEAGEPEKYLFESGLEVRTNDGDIVSGLKSFNQRLYIFKRNSFHVLSGDNPDNFFLQEVSGEYGALNNRAIAVFNDLMAFLDKKGVMLFDGAGFRPTSDKIQPTFDSMNVVAAQTEACMVHDKYRNEVLIGIPVNGATLNNLTVVYDYLANAWTTRDGFNPAVFAMVKQRLTTETAMYGSYSGAIMNFGASFLSHAGSGFTCYLKTRFLSPYGKTKTAMFRRLFLDTNQSGVTHGMSVGFYSDFGTSIVLSRTMYQTPTQTRIDFGVPAKSLAIDISHYSASLPLTIYGFGIAHKKLRDV